MTLQWTSEEWKKRSGGEQRKGSAKEKGKEIRKREKERKGIDRKMKR